MVGSHICEHTTRSDAQPRADADVSPDVDLSGAGSPKVKTPVHTVTVYGQSLPPRATVTFSQVITPPAGLKDATPKPLEAVVAGAHADGAETSILEDKVSCTRPLRQCQNRSALQGITLTPKLRLHLVQRPSSARKTKT